jgi:hypothetical protein
MLDEARPPAFASTDLKNRARLGEDPLKLQRLIEENLGFADALDDRLHPARLLGLGYGASPPIDLDVLPVFQPVVHSQFLDFTQCAGPAIG